MQCTIIAPVFRQQKHKKWCFCCGAIHCQTEPKRERFESCALGIFFNILSKKITVITLEHYLNASSASLVMQCTIIAPPFRQQKHQKWCFGCGAIHCQTVPKRERFESCALGIFFNILSGKKNVYDQSFSLARNKEWKQGS